ncbi:MAG: serine/threonine protein kinase [Planctomycetes bacterium]|nr:serine/threonine protein kinase [Planctomycetota bacterium]
MSESDSTILPPSSSDSPSSPEPRDEVDLSGRQLGDFRLLRRLGRGAMAQVYLAEQASLGRQVALKILKRDLAGDETYVQRFHHEARAAASLTHANIVQIFEVGCVDGVHYIAQEYVQGQNLAQVIARNGPPDVKLAVTIMRQAASALHKSAEHGIIHRDIKPENIMLTPDGLVKVADFGLARITRDEAAPNLTQIGMTMGTPLYMSPEQIEGKSLDSRSDIYSLGVTCFHMLTGQTPFRGETALSVAVQHLNEPPQRLENLRSDLPDGLCRIVHQMLEKNPDDRYQTARQLILDLRALQIPGGGGDDECPDDLEQWTTHEMQALVDQRTAATQQLDALMKSATAQKASRPGLLLIAGCLVAALLTGAAIAWSLREPPLLADADPAALTVAKKETVERQIFYASMLGTEAGWLAVEKHFPDETDAVIRAKQERAQIYLSQDQFEPALEIFDEMAAHEDESRRAFGLAGQAVVYHMQENREAFVFRLEELEKMAGDSLDPQQLKEKLGLDPRMIELIHGVIKKHQRDMDEELAAKWKNWQESRFSDDTASPDAG